ncbi:DUF397 domain-containing protein [Streptomyces sp. NPDC053542]|uniref:DUF397 domain-containing protein n=1 Tax=Streptomyces sp. NPDC053542 TaxID=3365710 RepID=UPI0037D59C93
MVIDQLQLHPTLDLSRISWRKSSYSGGSGGDCVEMGHGAPGAVPVRDSKNPGGPALVLPPGAWSAFVTAVRDGVLTP